MSSPHRESAPAVAFFGSDAIALPLLRALFDGKAWRLAGVVTQPDRPKGRGKTLQPNPIGAAAEGMGTTVLKPAKPGRALREWLVAEGVQWALVMAYGHILGPRLLATLDGRFLNFHASVLPKFRGASPVESAVATGQRETGVSLMQIVAAMDAGPVADLETVPIGPEDTAGDVRERLAAACVPLLERNLPRALAGNLTFSEQNHAHATFCRKLSKEDGQLDFHAPAAELVARINGLYPWPGCFVDVGPTRLKVAHARVLNAPAQTAALPPPGTVGALGDHGLPVACGDGWLAIGHLQKPGGRLLPAREFVRGFRLPEPPCFRSAPMTSLLVPPPTT